MISQMWNEERKSEYIRALENEEQSSNARRPLKNHEDIAQTANRGLEAMTEPIISEEKVWRCVQNMKGKTSACPDGLKLTSCLKREVGENKKMNEWKISKTRMIKKVPRPTAKYLRLIDLTNVAYKMFMTLMKNEIEEHLRENGAD